MLGNLRSSNLKSDIASVERVSDHQGIAAILIVFLLPICIAVEAWVVSSLWLWFVVPVWELAPKLSVPQTAGLLLIISLLKTTAKPDDDAWKALSKMMATGLVIPLIGFLIGSLIRIWL